VKILHCADLHIREKDIAEIERVLQFIIMTAKAKQEQPDLTVIAGDIFDSRDVKVDSQSAITAIGFISDMADICPVAIVEGTSSHDGAAPRIMQYVRGLFPVIVAEKPMQVILNSAGEFVTEADNEGHGLDPKIIITLIPQPTKQYWQSAAGISGADQEIGAAMGGVFAGFGAQAANWPGVPHIAAYHGSIGGATLSNGQTRVGLEIEVSADQLALLNADAVLCGHIHYPQQIGERIFYSGSVYMNNFGENHQHGFYVHDYSDAPEDAGWRSEFIETPCKKALRFAHDYTGNGGVPDNLLDLMAPSQDITGAHVRIDLTVWQDEVDKIDRDAIEKAVMGAAASCDIRITRVPRETVRAASVLAAESLREKIEKRAEVVGEQVALEILLLADLLQGSKAEELLKQVMGGGV